MAIKILFIPVKKNRDAKSQHFLGSTSLFFHRILTELKKMKLFIQILV